jgi:hypothetical protein
VKELGILMSVDSRNYGIIFIPLLRKELSKGQYNTSRIGQKGLMIIFLAEEV